MHKFIKFLLIVGMFFFLATPALAADVTLYFFWGAGCPHCAKEEIFLQSLEEKYPQLTIQDYEVTMNRNNAELLEKFGSRLHTDISGVPFTVIGDKYVMGYYNDQTTGKEIETAIRNEIEKTTIDAISEQPAQEAKPTIPPTDNTKLPESIHLPILGTLSIKSLSLPILTVVLAFLDGFNPCAMWTLLFLISLLLGMEDKRKRWILGAAFIAASSFVYFLFMAAWLNLLLFIGFIVWVRAFIGLLAMGGGVYNLREFFINKNGGCKVTGGEKRQAFFEKLKKITQQKQFLVALGGIILLAFAVNLVELICSAGLPVVFTQILTLSNLPAWQYYAYMILYIVIFMLDDLFIFFSAMVTLEITGISTKYSRLSHLVGGILMMIIGILLLFKPEWLMFG